VVEGRTHVAAERILRETIAMRVGEVKRILLGNRDDSVDSADAEHAELALVVSDDLLVSGSIATADKGNMDNIHGSLGRGIRIKLATKIIKDLGERRIKGASLGDNTENTIPDDTLILGNISEAE
jgi:acetylglutamate synthase